MCVLNLMQEKTLFKNIPSKIYAGNVKETVFPLENKRRSIPTLQRNI